MAIYYDLQVYKDSYTVLSETYKAIEHAPRSMRYTVGQDLTRSLMDLLLLIYQTNSTYERADLFLQMRKKITEIMVYFHIMLDMHALSEKAYGNLSQKGHAIMKQISAWQNYYFNNLKKQGVTPPGRQNANGQGC